MRFEEIRGDSPFDKLRQSVTKYLQDTFRLQFLFYFFKVSKVVQNKKRNTKSELSVCFIGGHSLTIGLLRTLSKDPLSFRLNRFSEGIQQNPLVYSESL